MDMIVEGRSMSLFQATQRWSKVGVGGEHPVPADLFHGMDAQRHHGF
jgi:hypothetical protein